MKRYTEKDYVDRDFMKGACTPFLVGRASLNSAIELNSRPTMIGRDRSCNVVLRDPSISSFHAQIFCRHGQYFIVDLNSTNGTKVNGQRISHFPERLRTGDLICIGVGHFVFQQDDKTEGPSETFTQTTPVSAEAELRRGAVRLPRSIVHWLRDLAGRPDSEFEHKDQAQGVPRHPQGIL